MNFTQNRQLHQKGNGTYLAIRHCTLGTLWGRISLLIQSQDNLVINDNDNST